MGPRKSSYSETDFALEEGRISFTMVLFTVSSTGPVLHIIDLIFSDQLDERVNKIHLTSLRFKARGSENAI